VRELKRGEGSEGIIEDGRREVHNFSNSHPKNY
jgi:hypothetical protein